MKSVPRFILPLFLICVGFIFPDTALSYVWNPVDPADLALKAPLVEKDADAEAIFWEVRVDDSVLEELSLRNYVRIKVFTDRGKESQSKVDLPYAGSNRIKDIAARVIKADGTIVELKKEDVLERTIVKANGVKVKAKSCALPGVEPGSIVEYRWREVRPNASANRLRLQFQRDIPAETVTYSLKPYGGMRYMPFHIGETRFVKDKDGFSKLTLSNVPAFHEEPQMPPEDQVRSWVFLYYTDKERKNTKDNKSPSDTLKRGMGSGSDIDLLFGALAKAAGFDARLALSGNR